MDLPLGRRGQNHKAEELLSKIPREHLGLVKAHTTSCEAAGNAHRHVGLFRKAVEELTALVNKERFEAKKEEINNWHKQVPTEYQDKVTSSKAKALNANTAHTRLTTLNEEVVKLEKQIGEDSFEAPHERVLELSRGVPQDYAGLSAEADEKANAAAVIHNGITSFRKAVDELTKLVKQEGFEAKREEVKTLYSKIPKEHQPKVEPDKLRANEANSKHTT